MPRSLEIEVMDDPVQVEAYASFDRTPVIDMYVNKLKSVITHGTVADLGCGCGDYYPYLSSALPNVSFKGYDASQPMLDIAKTKIKGLNVTVDLGNIKDDSIPASSFTGVISAFTLHQLDNPAAFWECVKRIGFSNAQVFIMDVVREEDPLAISKIVDTYTNSEQAQFRLDFINSLKAGFTVAEVKQQLVEAGITSLTVESIEIEGTGWKLMFITGNL